MICAKEVRIMDYNFELFNAITEALETLEIARATLIAAQQNAEEIYITTSQNGAYSEGE
jgi:hypothetical protein